MTHREGKASVDAEDLGTMTGREDAKRLYKNVKMMRGGVKIRKCHTDKQNKEVVRKYRKGVKW